MYKLRRTLVNTTELSMYDGDAAFLSNYFVTFLETVKYPDKQQEQPTRLKD